MGYGSRLLPCGCAEGAGLVAAIDGNGDGNRGERAEVAFGGWVAVSGLVVEELGGSFGPRGVGPGLFGGEQVAFGEGVFGEPGVGGAAGDAGEDDGGEVARDGAGDADRD